MPVKNYVPCKIAQNTKRNLVPWKAKAVSSRTLQPVTPAKIAKGNKLIPWQPSTQKKAYVPAVPASGGMVPLQPSSGVAIPDLPGMEESRALDPMNVAFGPESVPVQPTRLIHPSQRQSFRIPGAVLAPSTWMKEKCLRALDKSELKYIRTDFFYDLRDNFGSEKTLDTIMVEAHKRNIDILPLVHDRDPSSAERREIPDANNFTSPKILAEVRERCWELTNRYKPGGDLARSQGWRNDCGIRYWQIYSEQNHDRSLVRPWAYLRFFRACVEGIRSAYPEAKIVMGGLWGRFCGGYLNHDYYEGIPPRFYLDWLFRDDFFRENVDVIAIHPYRRPATPDKAQKDQFEHEYYCTLEGELHALKDFVDARSSQDLPIWLTEIGWHTDGDHVEKFRAAKCMTRSFNVMMDLPFVERVYWYNLMDDPVLEREIDKSYYLFRRDGTPTQAGEVLQQPPVHDGFPSSRTTGYTGLQRGNMTQRAYFKGRLSKNDKLSFQGFMLGRRPPGASQRGLDYVTYIDIFGPTEFKEPDFNWDTIGKFDRNEKSATVRVRNTGTYLIALRPIPGWEPRYYDIRFTLLHLNR